MVKVNLDNGTDNLDMKGKAVIAIVIDPAGHDADCAVLMLGESSPYAAAKAAGTGIGSIVNQLGKNTFDRVMLAADVIKQIKGALEGNTIKEEKIVEEEIVEKEIFNGKMGTS